MNNSRFQRRFQLILVSVWLQWARFSGVYLCTHIFVFYSASQSGKNKPPKDLSKSFDCGFQRCADKKSKLVHLRSNFHCCFCFCVVSASQRHVFADY